MQIIGYLPDWSAFFTYNGFKLHINFTEGLKVIAG